MPLPLIAIVGRPNVGKSMLFNKLTGKRLAIVEDVPGVTRDRLYGRSEWRGRQFALVDTGGIEPRTEDEMLILMRDQAQTAIETADVIILVTDVRTGVTAADSDVASMLLRSNKPVVLAVNKCDSTGVGVHPEVYEFYSLGLGEPVAVSALHGIGTDDLLDACFALFPDEAAQSDDDDALAVAVIGRPNVGKSSLVNRLLGEDRVIVSDVPGTTRDAIDTRFENEYGNYILIDTAGLRRKARVNDRVEYYSNLRTRMAVERADVCLIMIDAAQGVTEQDTKVAGMAHEAGKACVIVVNKWDAIEKDHMTMSEMRKDIESELSFMTYAPSLFISALTGQRVDKLFPVINSAAEQNSRRITTGQLNNVLSDATLRVQPPSDKGKRLKIYYMTQAGTKPPHFVAFVNNAVLFHFSYQRYIENCLRQTFGFEGTPIRLTVREKGEKD